MKTVEFLVVIDVTDNATEAEVRDAAQRCLTGALYNYAEAGEMRARYNTGVVDHTFGYRMVTTSPCRR